MFLKLIWLKVSKPLHSSPAMRHSSAGHLSSSFRRQHERNSFAADFRSTHQCLIAVMWPQYSDLHVLQPQ